MESFRRKTPEEILLSISKLHRGRLKIYIGAVSGSGKTYHMLREGQLLKQQGIDVVICAVSTRQRPETVEQVRDLERVPSIHWMKEETQRKDLNIDALLERNPEVVLVDGLAHTNRPEATFPTRLDDIQFLLSRGISVIATVNVYELEGAMELAKKWTGIVVETFVPADTLELADEVRLIDVTPETILKRLEEGHVQSDTAPSLFKRGNIAKLRELALRLVAEDVNESLEKHREEQGLMGPSGAVERILVSAQYHWNGSIYIRRGQQIARRLGGDLLVATLVHPKKTLTKEAAAFKRSIVKLAEKIGASFEELPLTSRWRLSSVLLQYAVEHNVTRIVLGHSKQSFWQELWRGSVVNGILKKTKNVDVYFVADRAEQEGERILPTKMQVIKQPKDPYRRLSHAEVEEKIEEIRKGRFKVYIGAAPGVGKTYTMLREGNDLLKKGIDVVIGLLEAHERKETSDQVGLLQMIPRETILYRGTTLQEMDTAAIIRRNPEVVLVDELAHTNMPGSKHKKRYEDIAELLEAGISVISTMNVQHLESLNDAVEQITGVRVRETVPDHILRMADEVELIDVAPKSLQQRMREGKIYALNKVDQALGNFFKIGNLIALRELALRELADDVDERLEAWERKDSLRGPWRRRESIFVGVTTSPNAERLIRRGFRIAYRLKADWVVTYVHSDPVIPDELKQRIQVLQDLTARLRGRFEILNAGGHSQIPHILLKKANTNKSTQMIVGQSKPNFWAKITKKSVVKTIMRHGRHMDVLVVADFDPHAEK
ncbi:histidine kinase [Paenibacillus eucommiae]|uniref:Two-component system sensor histidine kinase KdpD n=1 Tax=Paenibacillus eucommiae TaxID=1355755 RepID=A0ABS4IR09_9BACL|nr:histidine kinase [Paenibacillus eucommiae]MBP1989953.1 two-component system sensor histidine kinase KdpD [Paenibacillus eucommiae]